MLALVLLAACSVTYGSYAMDKSTVARALLGREGGAASIVVWNIRLPRIAAAVAAGWSLSLAGLCLQSLLRNPLASPATLGISHGAAFGAAFAVVVLGAEVMMVTVFAFFGAAASTLVILFLAHLRRLTPESVILAGVALSSLFASATVLIQYLASETELALVVFWAFGDVARSSWSQIGLVALVGAVSTAALFIRRWDLNALGAGDETARGLGVSVGKVRLAGLAGAALLAALVTAFPGVIAFLGLVAPHMARRLVGRDHRLLLPCAAVLGALLLLAADTFGRLLVGSGSFPVGVLTSFMGAPVFLILLMGRRS